jgi:multiple sugar transport system substrate-binding protein
MAPDLETERPETGALVASQHLVFTTAFPTITLTAMPKMAYGAGGLTDLLLAMAPVVPSRLPDVVAVDTSELGLLVAGGLATPLDDLMPPALWDDLYPFALEAATFDDNLYGLPFQADISFLAYNSGLLEAPPRTWDDLIAAKSTLLMPAAQGDGSAADAFLIHYIARGGRVSRAPMVLDSTIAARVLRDYRTALETGVLTQQVRDLQTLEECWSVYLSGGAAMAHVGSWQYLRDQPLLKRTRFGAIPTPGGEAVTVARSWSWVIITESAERRQAAASYLATMMDAQWLGQWGLISYHLPPRRSSLTAIEDQDFRAFVEDQLLHASPYPASPIYPQMQAVLARAVEDVLDGITTPERAAISAAAAVSRLGQ